MSDNNLIPFNNSIIEQIKSSERGVQKCSTKI